MRRAAALAALLAVTLALVGLRLAVAPVSAGFRLPLAPDGGGGVYLADPARGLVHIDPAGRATVAGRLPAGQPLDLGRSGGGFLLGTDEGLFESTGGDRWERAPGTPRARFRAVAADGDLLAGAAWAGAVWLSQNGGRSWHASHAPAAEVLALGADSPTLLAAGLQGVLRSDDAGANWEPVEAPGRLTALAAGPEAYLAAAWSGTVYRSDDRGATWRPQRTVPGGVWRLAATDGLVATTAGLYSDRGRAPGRLGSAEVTELAVSGRYDYAEAAGGRVFVSGDHAASWSAVY